MLLIPVTFLRYMLTLHVCFSKVLLVWNVSTSAHRRHRWKKKKTSTLFGTKSAPRGGTGFWWRRFLLDKKTNKLPENISSSVCKELFQKDEFYLFKTVKNVNQREWRKIHQKRKMGSASPIKGEKGFCWLYICTKSIL